MTEKKKRDISIDVIRGIAIALVVMGHCIQCGSGRAYFNAESFYDDWCFRVIYSFHMPLFAWISGYCFFWSMKKGGRQTIGHLLKSLILPMICWSPIQVLINNLIDGKTASIYSFATAVIRMFFNGYWFLWGIVLCSVLLFLTIKLFNGSTRKVVFALECIATLFAFRHFTFYQYAFLYPYFVIGYVFHRHESDAPLKKENNVKYVTILWTIIYLILIPLYNKDDFIYVSFLSIVRGPNSMWRQLTIDLYRYVIGLAGTMMMLYGCRILCNGISNRFKQKVIQLFSLLGTLSLGIYIISGSMAGILLLLFPESSPHAGFWILEFISITLLSSGITLLIQKNHVLKQLLLGGR